MPGSFCFSFAAILAAVFMWVSSARAINILENPGFESDWAGWTVDSAVNWNTYVEYQNPPHAGNRIFKVFGCWCGNPTLQGIYQDNPAAPGSTYTAGGWIISPSGDHTANESWVEVNFLNAGGTVIEKYQSAHFTPDSPQDVWQYFEVTNKIDPNTISNVIGTVSSLVAPPGTTTVRFRCQHEQINDGGGAVWFDDVVLDQASGNRPPTIADISPSGSALFSSAAGGLTFSVTSDTTNISTSGITVVLNGLDISSSLVITGPANNRSVAYNGLKSNRVYTASISVVDDAGFPKTATVSFDTFVTGNFIWEGEDYNFNGGQYINNPVPSSTTNANSYFDKVGTPEIDFYESGTWGGNHGQGYRETEFNIQGQGPGAEWCGDVARQKYLDAIAGGDADVHDYDIGWWNGGLTGDWVNYTRDIPAGTYNIYGRLSYDNGQACVHGFWHVTSGATTATQTTTKLGEFHFRGRGWQAYDWVPLTDADGNLVSITLNGVTTFRTGGNANVNFFMLAPARDDLPVISALYPAGQHPFEPTNTLAFHVSSTVATIPADAIHVTLNGLDVSPLLTITGTENNRSVTFAGLASNARYNATISVLDSAGTPNVRQVKFDTFSESSLMFEAEDYDFDSGKYINDPVLSTATATNNYYFIGLLAIEGVDISTNLPSSGAADDYGRHDIIGTQPALDYVRQAYVAAQVTDPGVRDYNVGWWVSGSWLNYTRDLPAGSYWVYGRLASPGQVGATLDRVTSGVGTPNQTTELIGTFLGSASGWQDWIWAPVLAADGTPATLTVNGKTTLRVNNTTGNFNGGYYMLIPAKARPQLTASTSAGNPAISFPSQAGVSYTVLYKKSLSDANWNLLTVVLGDGTTKTVVDTAADGQRFYRVLIQ